MILVVKNSPQQKLVKIGCTSFLPLGRGCKMATSLAKTRFFLFVTVAIKSHIPIIAIFQLFYKIFVVRIFLSLAISFRRTLSCDLRSAGGQICRILSIVSSHRIHFVQSFRLLKYSCTICPTCSFDILKDLTISSNFI